jgi:uncharacterized membrane-anchored protein
MTTTFAAARRHRPGGVIEKLPEVDALFWIVKILCLTVGATFAEAVSGIAGASSETTAVIFLAAFAAVLLFQLSLDRYVPEAYWLAVTMAGAFATCFTTVLTDDWGVTPSAATVLLALLLAAVLAVWQALAGTLSLDRVNSLEREGCYWTAVLVSFVLGETGRVWAVQDISASPFGTMLMPAFACAAVLIAHRVGAYVSISFWIAFVLTGSFGADLGDWMRAARSDGGVGLGTGTTTGLFLVAIVLVTAYRASRRVDVDPATHKPI